MYDYDHMLNGQGSKQRLQQTIKDAQRHKNFRAIKEDTDKLTKPSAIRMALVKVLTTITKVITS